MSFKNNLPSGMRYTIETEDGHSVLQFCVEDGELKVRQYRDYDDESHAALSTKMDARQAQALRDYLTVVLDPVKESGRVFSVADHP